MVFFINRDVLSPRLGGAQVGVGIERIYEQPG